MDLTTSNAVLNVLGPCLPGSTVPYQRRRRRHRSLDQVIDGRLGFCLCCRTRRLCQEPPWPLCDCAPWPFSWATTANRQSARSDIGRHLPIPLFLATYTVYTAAYYRTEIRQRSTVKGSTLLQGRTLFSRVLRASFGFHLLPA
jgi:hypothetical protein